MYMGYVDIAQRDKIVGWAADSEAPDAALELAIVVNGREAGRVKADRLRLDLKKLGKFGEGRHGFEFNFEPPLDPAAEHDVVVRIAGSPAVLPRGAFKIRRGPEPTSGIVVPAGHADDRASRHAAPATTLPRYVVHVGLPKTGTKYLQHNFWRLRQQLREQGVYYPSEWWQQGPIFAHHELAEGLRKAPDARIAEIFSQLNACGSATVLLSSEGFNPIPISGLEYLRDLTQGARIEIVFYARRWSDWLPSQWQQAVKQGSLQTFPEWYASLLSSADTHPGINQAIYLDKFAKVFGRNNIRLVSYSNLVDRNVDIFDHFCSRILNLAASPSIKGRGDLVHESMGALLTELIRNLNARQVMRSGKSGYHVFEAYRDISADPAVADDVALLYAAMRRHVVELPLDDDIFFLKPIYARLNEYSDLLVNPEYGSNVFRKQRGQCRYVRSEYLMEDGVMNALGRISDALRKRLAATAAATRPAE